MEQNIEQRYAIRFCVRLQINATETFKKLKQAYGDQVLSRAQVFRWHKAFLFGRETVEDEPRSGRPVTSRTEENATKVKTLVKADRRLTVRMIGDELNLNHQTVHNILTKDLGMRKTCAKLIPKDLTQEQKVDQKDVCVDLLERVENEPDFLKHLITGNESCIFQYNPETKRQSMEWHTSNSPSP